MSKLFVPDFSPFGIYYEKEVVMGQETDISFEKLCS